MAAIILVIAGVVVWLEIRAMGRIRKTSFIEAEAAFEAPTGSDVEVLLTRTADEIATLLDLQACWFEPFPFDALLPRIEQGRIVLPPAEPGITPYSNAGVELPVRSNQLTLGRFVLVPPVPSVGVIFPPTTRDHAIELAARAGPHLAAALSSGEASCLRRDA